MAMLLLDLKEEEEALRNAEKAWEITAERCHDRRESRCGLTTATTWLKRNEMRGHAERLGYQGLENLDRMFENQ